MLVLGSVPSDDSESFWGKKTLPETNIANP